MLRRTQAALDRINQQLKRQPNERLSVAEGQQQEKVRRLASGEVVPLEMELVVLVRAKTADELSAKAAAIKSAFQGMNGAQYYEATLAASARNMFAHCLPGWMGSRRRSFVHYGEDRYVADLLPLANTFAGHPGAVEALFPGPDSNLVNAAMFLGEGRAATPQNVIIPGAPGTGKSLVLTKLLLETEPSFGFTGLVEEGLSQAPYTRSFGVEPIVFRLDGRQTLNPFDTQGLPLSSFARASLGGVVARMVGLPADEDKARRQAALITRHVAQLCADHAREQLSCWPEQRRVTLVRHALALDRWAAQHGLSETEAFVDFREWQQREPAEAAASLAQLTETELREFESTHTRDIHDLVFAYLRPEEHLTLSALREYFEIAEDDELECRWLATLLVPWCSGGNCSGLFDGVSNVALIGQVVHFELGLIPEAAKEIKAVVGFQVINGLRHYILSLPRLMRKRIVIEEVSRFLDVPGGEAILRELFEQFRKHNCQVILTVQSFSRIADSSIRVALVGNARAWLIFNTGSRQDIERLGQEIGLSRVAQEAILRFPRPDQQTGAKYSEFLYWHSDARQPICGIVRYVLLPHELPEAAATASPVPKT
jgi:type IV secretory pathway VirB4 component